MDGQNLKKRRPSKRQSLKKQVLQLRSYLPQLPSIPEGREDQDQDDQQQGFNPECYPTRRRRVGMAVMEMGLENVCGMKMKYLIPLKAKDTDAEQGPEAENPEPDQVRNSGGTSTSENPGSEKTKATGKKTAASLVEQNEGHKIHVVQVPVEKDPNKDPALKTKLVAFVVKRRDLAQLHPRDPVNSQPDAKVDFGMKFICAGQDCPRNPKAAGYMCPRGHFFCEPCFMKRRRQLQDSFPVLSIQASGSQGNNQGLCGYHYPRGSKAVLRQKLNDAGFGYGKLPEHAKGEHRGRERDLVRKEVDAERCLRVTYLQNATDPLYVAAMKFKSDGDKK